MDELAGTIQLAIILVFAFFAISGMVKCEISARKNQNTMTCLEKQMADFDKCEVLRK